MRAFLSVALEHCPEMKSLETSKQTWEAIESRARDCKATVEVEVWVTGQVDRGIETRQVMWAVRFDGLGSPTQTQSGFKILELMALM
jgi:hypothetical protein